MRNCGSLKTMVRSVQPPIIFGVCSGLLSYLAVGCRQIIYKLPHECSEALASSTFHPNCSSANLVLERPVCEIQSFSDTTALRNIAMIAGMQLVCPYDTHNGHEHHEDVIKWKHFPRYWPFVREIHQSPVNSLPKGEWREALVFSFICLNKRLNKQSRGWWFETPSRPLWRHCNDKDGSCESNMSHGHVPLQFLIYWRHKLVIIEILNFFHHSANHCYISPYS